jgi:hypothetical protein
MKQPKQIFIAAVLTLSLASVSYGGTISGSASVSRTGTITGSRTGTITGSRAGTITGSKTGTITGSSSDSSSPSNQDINLSLWDGVMSRMMILLLALGW